MRTDEKEKEQETGEKRNMNTHKLRFHPNVKLILRELLNVKINVFFHQQS